jgi:hypothetical protein
MIEAKSMNAQKALIYLGFFVLGFLVGGLGAELTGSGGPQGLWDGIRPIVFG